MHKGLRKVPAQLALLDVVLLGEQAGRAAAGTGTLEPAVRPRLVTLLVQGQAGGEAAQQERALALAEREIAEPPRTV